MLWKPIRISFVLAAATVLCALPRIAGAAEYEFRQGEWVRQAEPGADTPAGQAARVRELQQLGKSRRAVKAAERFLDEYPDDPMRERAMYYAGAAEMDRGNYYSAFEWFELQLDEFPDGDFANDALRREFEIADAFLNGRKRRVAYVFRLPARSEGLEILTRIAEHAPGTELAQQAMLRIGDHHYSRDQWYEAVDAYDQFVDTFPNSDRASHAMLQAARAMYAAFHGIAYDATPLIDADQRFRAFAAQYPGRAEEAGVNAILWEIHNLRAHKMFETARFYERVHRPTSAAFCYRKVIDTYGETDWAGDARDALARLGEPVRPPATDAGAEPAAMPEAGES